MSHFWFSSFAQDLLLLHSKNSLKTCWQFAQDKHCHQSEGLPALPVLTNLAMTAAVMLGSRDTCQIPMWSELVRRDTELGVLTSCLRYRRGRGYWGQAWLWWSVEQLLEPGHRWPQLWWQAQVSDNAICLRICTVLDIWCIVFLHKCTPDIHNYVKNDFHYFKFIKILESTQCLILNTQVPGTENMTSHWSSNISRTGGVMWPAGLWSCPWSCCSARQRLHQSWHLAGDTVRAGGQETGPGAQWHGS